MWAFAASYAENKAEAYRIYVEHLFSAYILQRGYPIKTIRQLLFPVQFFFLIVSFYAFCNGLAFQIGVGTLH